jgi:hypothetical protein
MNFVIIIGNRIHVSFESKLNETCGDFVANFVNSLGNI